MNENIHDKQEYKNGSDKWDFHCWRSAPPPVPTTSVTLPISVFITFSVFKLFLVVTTFLEVLVGLISSIP